MNNWKNYAGSVLLAGLLLQGCSSDKAEETTQAKAADTTTGTPATTTDQERLAAASEIFADASDADRAQSQNELTLKILNLAATNSDMRAFLDKVIADEASIDNDMQAAQAVAAAITGADVSASANRSASRSGLLSGIKSGITDLLNTSVGGALTGAAFNVVLNSEGVTVVMLDAARGSRTISQVMIDAIGRNTQLFTKMCPMLQTNQEFGEKFAALAYEMYPETKEGAPDMGNFFFSVVDGSLYGCLTDAMLLSNKDYTEPKRYQIGSVEHSTTAYMGLLMERYAAKFFIKPGTGVTPIAGYGSTDAFAKLMFDTGANADFNSTSSTFTNHGDANELANEQLFYALFKTPGSTNSFIGAMKQLDPEVQKMFMDKIFLGSGTLVDNNGTVGISNENPDTVQGYLNIIAVGSAMYDGIYGEKDDTGARVNAYGFDAYMGSFLDFAMLIPGDRYFAYSSAFINAGYEFAAYNGINVWENISTGAQNIWDGYFADNNVTAETNATVAAAPSRSAMQGKYSTNWFSDIGDLFYAAIANAFTYGDASVVDDNLSYWDTIVNSTTSAYDWVVDENTTILGSISAQTDETLAALSNRTDIAINTLIDGRNDANVTLYPTTVQEGVENGNNEVYGLHGLVELAIREDMVKAQQADGNTSYTMADAEAEFTLPLFAESLTWNYAYTSATDSAEAYYNSTAVAAYIVDFKENGFVDSALVQEYFYPDANNTYIPNSLLAIDWLKLPGNFSAGDIQATDFNFDSGYLDIYIVSKNAALTDDVDLTQAVGTTMTRVDMGSDSIIAVDENGQTLDGLYVYKIRVISPEQTASVFDYLGGLVDSAGNYVLDMVGLDSNNAGQSAGTAVTEDNNAS